MDETVRVLINPTAGRGKAQQRLRDIGRAVQAVRSCEVIPTTSADHARAVAAEAAGEGATRLLVAGGDGMVHAAVQGLAGTPTELGILPVGTANDTAASLGLTTGDLQRWARVAARAEAVPIDAGRTDHGWFLSVLTFGVSGTIIERSNRFTVPLGAMRYTAAVLLSLRHWKGIPLRLTVDGERREAPTMLMALGNTIRFGGGMRICPTADPTDGLGDLVLVDDVSIPTVLRVLPRVFTGGHLRHPAVSNERGRTFGFDLPGGYDGPPVGVYGDGEFLGNLPTTAEIVPGALRVAGAQPSRPAPFQR